MIEQKAAILSMQCLVPGPGPPHGTELVVSAQPSFYCCCTTQSNMRTNERAREYGQAVLEIGKDAKVPTVDLWTVCEGDNDNAYPTYLVDGLHLNAK